MRYADRYRIRPRSRVVLAKRDPAETGKVSKAEAKRLLDRSLEHLADAQERLYAQDTWSLLLVFQAMDAAGKDSTIKHVMSGVNPQGCQVFSFKAPSDEELDHDFLWRSARALPERGRIGIHNRSHYEEVLVVRVHPEFLERQKVPLVKDGKELWKRRFREINDFERHLVENGTVVLKFFLNVSKDEQRRRFLDRLDRPDKHWKFSASDVHERAHWDAYMAAYEDVFRHTSTPWAPWFVVPADHKWYTRLVVAEIVCETLDAMDLRFPKVPKDVREEWKKLRAALAKER